MGQSPREQRDEAAEQLLDRFEAGDQSALHRLVDVEVPRLLRRVEGRLPDKFRARIGASDIVQHTAVEFISLRERFENRGLPAFRKFMNTLADFNLARAIERESAKKRDVDRESPNPSPASEIAGRAAPLDRLAADVTSPSLHAMKRETSHRVGECFEQLSLADRTIIVLIDYDDRGYPEAARILEISEEAARARHSRAVKRLRNMLKND